jgi:mannose-6-phosphate isomerase-like protein (cupin superfamily)
VFVHNDSRRTLYEWAQGTFRCAKALIIKAPCSVGDHYHRHKDESFLLLSGHANEIVVGNETHLNVSAPYAFHVPRGTYHRFDLQAGSVLLGTATAEFDPEDEVQGKP